MRIKERAIREERTIAQASCEITLEPRSLQGFVVKLPGPGQLRVEISPTLLIGVIATKRLPADPAKEFFFDKTRIPVGEQGERFVFVKSSTDEPTDVTLTTTFVPAAEISLS